MNKRQVSRTWLYCRLIIALALIGWGVWTFWQYISPNSDLQKPQEVPIAAAGEPTKKTEQEKVTYTVPASHPRQLIIPALGINANVLSLGVAKDNAMEAPVSAWDVGWYNDSGLPGVGYGALLIDGHVNDSLGSPGVFYGLDKLKMGDEVTIERGDKAVFLYRVVQVEQKTIDQVDMSKMLRSVNPGKEGLNMITCGGTYDKQRQTYRDRILVYAERSE